MSMIKKERKTKQQQSAGNSVCIRMYVSLKKPVIIYFIIFYIF